MTTDNFVFTETTTRDASAFDDGFSGGVMVTVSDIESDGDFLAYGGFSGGVRETDDGTYLTTDFASLEGDGVEDSIFGGRGDDLLNADDVHYGDDMDLNIAEATGATDGPLENGQAGGGMIWSIETDDFML